MPNSTITSNIIPSVSDVPAPNTYHHATGPIEYTLLNDYMFHIVFQNIDILKGFLCALLKLHPKQIHSVIVNNPINPHESINGKTFILDIQITLNDNILISLELQVVNENNWPERSLSYLCRTFDSLNKGEDYTNTREAIHISILDFTLFPKHPEFYACHKLMNVKTHHIYSDKFRLNVLDLNQIDLATDEDKARGLDLWAAFFKATTWEELKMYTTQNSYMNDAAQKLYEASADFLVRENCRRKREWELREKRAAKLEIENVTLQNEITAQKNEISAQKDEIAMLRAKLAKYESEE